MSNHQDEDDEELTDEDRVYELDEDAGDLIDDLDVLRNQMTEAVEAADPELLAKATADFALAAQRLAVVTRRAAELRR